MAKQINSHAWLKAGLTLFMLGLLLTFSHMSAARAADIRLELSRAAAESFTWQYDLDFNSSSYQSASLEAQNLLPALQKLGIQSELQALKGKGYQLQMSGDQGLQQLRRLLYSPQLANFLGGPGEISLDLPATKGQPLILHIDSNISTGYTWAFDAGAISSFTATKNPTYKTRSNTSGAPSVESVTLLANNSGSASLKLLYRRPFGSAETPTRHLQIHLASPAASIDLTDPHPKLISLESPTSYLVTGQAALNKLPKNLSLPSSLDWRDAGIVPPVRNQASCGSCWAFGTVGAMEPAIARAGGPLLDLSEQFLVSCNTDGWNCESGGLTAHKYHFDTLAADQTSVGAVLEADLPYTATDGTCGTAFNHPYQLSGWDYVTTQTSVPTVDQIKSAIATYGPVTVAMCAGPGFQAYSGGISTTDDTSNCGGGTNHMVVLVGWNDADGGYWYLRNSWGAGWGESGYMRIAYGLSNVGYGTSWVTWGGGVLTGTITASAGGAPLSGATVDVSSGASVITAADGTYSVGLPAGTYVVTASHYGYQPVTASGVVITDGNTTTHNFALTTVPSYQVTGTVTDASTGWPLYASIDIPGYPGGTVWTDPAMGTYSVSLAAARSYTFHVEAWTAGYVSIDHVVGPLTVNTEEDFGLAVNAATCSAPGLIRQGLSEGFEFSAPPALPPDWATAQVSGTAGAWGTHTGTVHPAGKAAHGGSNLVYFNSFSAVPGNQTRLYQTSGINMTLLTDRTLKFWIYHDTNYSSADDTVQVQVSSDGGATWDNIGTAVSRYDGSIGWQEISRDLSAYASATDLRIAFLASSQYGSDIHLDDISLGYSCDRTAGGLVVGTVTDANTSAGLTGATVSSGSHSTTTAITADPALADGFYTLFSPAGAHDFTASKSGFAPVTQSVAVSLNNTVRQDFALDSPALAVDPSPVEVTVPLGETLSTNLTITNSGGADGDFSIHERDLGFSPLVTSRPGDGRWLYRAAEGIKLTSNAGQDALAYPSAYRWSPNGITTTEVLVYTDDWIHPAPNTFIDQAMQSLSIAYTAHYDGDFSGFEADLASKMWTMVIFEGDNYTIPASTLTVLNTYVTNGGFLGVAIWNMVNIPAHPLYGSLGISYVGNYTGPTPATHWWVPTHAIFTTPDTAPEWVSNSCPAGISCGQYVDPVPGSGTAIGGYSLDLQAGQAGLVVKTNGRTVFKAFLDPANTGIDANTDGVKDGVALWINIAHFLLSDIDIPWLAETPTSGTVTAGSTLPVGLTFDTSALTETGIYTGMLRMTTSDPVHPVFLVPVNMTVTGKNLTVTKSGTGAGSVSSVPAGIDCGSDCFQAYRAGTPVILTAAPEPGSTFTGWSGGGCSGTGTCTVVMNADATVDAAFTMITYTISGNAGAAGVALNYDNGGPQTVTSGATGTYSLTIPWNWTGTVSPRLLGHAFTPIHRSYTNVLADQTDQDYSVFISADMAIKGKDTDIFNGDTSPSVADDTDFGFINLTGGSAAHTFTILNQGLLDLDLSGSPDLVAITGANSADFSVISQPDSNLAIGASTSFTVKFVPGGTGMRTATISIANSDSGKNPYTYVIQGRGYNPDKVYIVDDDDNGPDVSAAYTGVLTSLGKTFDEWDTNNSDNEPTVNDLAGYKTVIWFSGDEYGGFAGPGPAGTAALSSWLDAGGCLMLSSQDYIYDRHVTPFATDYLGVNTAASDVFQTIVSGAGSVFSGLGPYTLSYPFTNYSDIIHPNSTAELAFSGDKGDAAVNKTTPFFRTAFLGFPFEALPTADDQKAVMSSFLTWCGSAPKTLTVVPAGNGAGTVTSAPAGINCGTACSHEFNSGATVTINPTPAAGSLFSGWTGGGCGATLSCAVSMNADKVVEARFTLAGYSLAVVSVHGTVTRTPDQSSYHYGDVVHLTASPADNYVFSHWSGGASGTDPQVDVTIHANTTITANYLPKYSLTVLLTGAGTGTVTSLPAGINCGLDCEADYVSGTSVTLTASAGLGSTFTGWTGSGCSGFGTCTVAMTAAKAVAANFVVSEYTLTVISPHGTVTSTPGGINCGSDCSESYTYNTIVTLTAIPATGYTFSGWSGGGCSGTGTCTVTLHAAATVTASYQTSEFKIFLPVVVKNQ